ncbi:MAG: DNA translocase FtsK 4TM domain-containing protein, partial [Campylobacterales bacterium]
MRQALFITILAVIVYAGISTIIADAAIIGTVGEIIAKANRALFGYISFAYLFLLLYPLYCYYKNAEIDVERTEKILATILLFFSLLILQALVVSGPLRGALGAGFVDFLHPYIGTFGLWVFWVMTVSIAAVILIDAEKFPSLPKPKIPFALKEADDEVRPEPYRAPEPAKKRTAARRSGSVQPDLFEEEDPFDAPAYERLNIPLEGEDAPIKIVPKTALQEEEA